MIAGKRKLFFFLVEDPACMRLFFHEQNLLLKTSQRNLIRQVVCNVHMKGCMNSAYALGICCMVQVTDICDVCMYKGL